ncbi:MAG TPA: hypothetical protein VHS06_11355 [Chloroflexota bacterium]|nr:hypothetical protein [Chloroflexota bacterium]
MASLWGRLFLGIHEELAVGVVGGEAEVALLVDIHPGRGGLQETAVEAGWVGVSRRGVVGCPKVGARSGGGLDGKVIHGGRSWEPSRLLIGHGGMILQEGVRAEG